MSSIDVTIIGAGSWGKALAHNLLKNNKKILMYSRQQVKQQQVNNANISLTYDLENIFTCKAPCVIATPVKSLNEIGLKIKKEKFNEPIILTCKGIDSSSGKFPSQIFDKYTSSNNLAVLSGPSFASEVLDDKPTAVTIASKNKEVTKIFSKMFQILWYYCYYAIMSLMTWASSSTPVSLKSSP